MEILKKGENPKNNKYKVTCWRCETIFAYVKKEIISDQRDGDYIKCPTCGNATNHKEKNKLTKFPIWSPSVRGLPSARTHIDSMSDMDMFRELYMGNFKPVKDVPFIIGCYDPANLHSNDYSVIQLTHRSDNGKVFHIGEYKTQDRKEFKQMVDSLSKFFTPLNSKWLKEE